MAEDLPGQVGREYRLQPCKVFVESPGEYHYVVEVYEAGVPLKAS